MWNKIFLSFRNYILTTYFKEENNSLSVCQYQNRKRWYVLEFVCMPLWSWKPVNDETCCNECLLNMTLCSLTMIRRLYINHMSIVFWSLLFPTLAMYLLSWNCECDYHSVCFCIFHWYFTDFFSSQNIFHERILGYNTFFA